MLSKWKSKSGYFVEVYMDEENYKQTIEPRTLATARVNKGRSEHLLFSTNHSNNLLDIQ